MNVIDRRAGGDAIFFGAEVDLESDAGAMTVRIVGSDEIDPARRFISVDSPLARALLKKQVDDQVSILVEDKKLVYWVLGIRYPEGLD